MIPISPYYVMAFMGVTACLATQCFNFTQTGFEKKTVLKIVLLSFLCLWAGAGCAVLGFWQNEGVFVLPAGEWFHHIGLAAYPFMIGMSLFFILGCAMLKLDIQQTSSIAAPALAILFAFGRVGCSIAGCCYGIPIHFVLFGYSFNRFPTAQLESLFFWLLFISLQLFIVKRRVVIMVMSYSVFRFCNEFFRGDDRGTLFPGCPLSPAQTIALILFTITLTHLLYGCLKKTAGKTAPLDNKQKGAVI